VRYAPQSAVEAAWVEIYRDDRPDNQLRALGEVLAEIADRFEGWRQAHVTMVRRTMGEKVGSGGSAGLAWLRRGLAEPVFPELWSARTAM
jgi:tryptophan 2,3-dioxygenase